MSTDPTALFEEYRRTGRRSVRNRIVEDHMGLAVHIARGFEHGSRRDHDIEQVAMLALVKAVDRFDPTLGVPFTNFAGRTIEGEIKRHFRDATWAVKVPRGAKELNVAVRKAVDQLSVSAGRSPTVDEVARHLGIDRDDVLTGLGADGARRASSIDPGPGDDDSPSGEHSQAVASIEAGFGNSVAAADLNGDGKPDLAVANNGSNTVSVLLNNGNGTFAARLDYSTGSSPRSVAVADLNGDARPDLAVANQNSTTVSVLLTSCLP